MRPFWSAFKRTCANLRWILSGLGWSRYKSRYASNEIPERPSAMQRTLILLKPDAVQRRLIGTLIQRFEQKGLRLVGMKLVHAGRDLAEKHYAVHKGKPFYESLLQFLVAGPTVALVWEGREAVAVARTLMGP